MSNDRFPPTPLSDEQIRKITASYDAWLVQHDKQVRAEVLAACKEALRESADVFTNAEHADLFGLAIKVLENVQPAAKDLEELLRQEREEALLGIVAWRKDLLEAWRTDSRALMTALLEGGPNLSVEKAHAILEKR